MRAEFLSHRALHYVLRIRGTLAGTPPANAATLARQAFLASRTNFYLSVPMLFFMAASYHYVIFGQ